MTDEVARSYSWTGQKGNIKLKDTPMMNILIGNFSALFKFLYESIIS